MPEASTLGRLRSQLVEHDLWERLLKEINRQTVTVGNVHDSDERDTLFLGDETALLRGCGLQFERDARQVGTFWHCRSGAR